MSEPRVDSRLIVGIGLGKLHALCQGREQTSCRDIVVGILSHAEARPEIESMLEAVPRWRQLVSDLEDEASSLVARLMEKENAGDHRFAAAVLHGNESTVDFNYAAERVFLHALRSIEGRPVSAEVSVADLFWAMSVVGAPLDPFCERYFQDEEFVGVLESIRSDS